jgi:hypothetical protein
MVFCSSDALGDTLAEFVLARASIAPADGTIRSAVGRREQNRTWFGRPLWEIPPAAL